MKSLVYFMLILLCLDAGSRLKTMAVSVSTPSAVVEEKSLIRTHGVKINVDDMDRALSFYRDKLGFELEDRSTYPQSVVLKSGERNRLILFKVKKLRKAEPTDTGVSFTLQVNDLDEAIAKMKSKGVEFAENEKRTEGVGYAIFIRDPFGRRISLMHQTIVKVEPFKEPRLYNYGFSVPDMQTARDFYSNKLGFLVRSEKYLPKDLPLGHQDKSFGFMLHYRPGVKSIKSSYPNAVAYYTIVFETDNLVAALEKLRAAGVQILDKNPRQSTSGPLVAFADPFGNVSELLEVKSSPAT